MTNMLVPLDEVKTWLEIPLGDTSYDDVLTSCIKAASGIITQYCSTDFSKKTIVGELLDGGRNDIIVPEVLPIISVERLVIGVATDLAPNSGYELDVTTDIVVSKDSIKLKRLNTPTGRGNVVLDYTAGYESVPDEVIFAAKISAEAFYQRRTRRTIGIASRSKQGESESFTAAWDKDIGLPKEAVSILQAYVTFEWPNVSVPTRNY